MKKVLIPAAAAVACGCIGLAFVAGCVISNGVDFVHSIAQNEKAVRTENHALELAEAGTLEISLSAGDVVVRADSLGTPEVAAAITAYGKDADAAKKALDDTRLVVERTSTGARIELAGEPVEQRASGIRVVSRPRADLELRIPKDVRLVISVASGDIRTHGPIGASKLTSSYGDLNVEKAKGDLVLQSSSGKVEVGELREAQNLDARSGYGDVRARLVEASAVKLSSSSGSVHLEDATCTRVELQSSYGDVVARRLRGDLVAKTSSGDVRLEDVQGAELRLSSGYGDVDVRTARGDLAANTSSGDIVLAGFEGSCELASGYGDVRAEGRLERASGRSNSGSVRIRALPGSQLASDWKLQSGYGDVALTLPSTISFELAARTGYGTLDLQVPITVAAGGLKDKRAVQGRVGDGGRRIELGTSSGDVHLARQD
ncbi:MAG: DUF4097 family beta strand repeat protein [Planctomycetes bacterium]|nr:DUF4097 family beta strand repeat protein [Planctomycetota bacterium]